MAYNYKSKKYSTKNSKKNNKFRNELCSNNMTFQDCELAILRHAVDETEKLKGENIIQNEEIKKILTIVERFLKNNKLVCYGGTAINEILPKEAQFYNRDIEIPDYDFYSTDAMNDAKRLADIYYKHGYTEVEAKSGVHFGTYKVFVNFIPIADITQLHKNIFKTIYKEAITISGIKFAPPNFLRMNMYLELSRPQGDVSRWEKVLKRLNLLNKYYPLKNQTDKCEKINFQTKREGNDDDNQILYILARDALIDQGVIFFGGYATSLYSKYMKNDEKQKVRKIPDFDVLAEDIEKCADVMKERLTEEGYKNIKIIEHEEIHEIIPKSIELKVGNNTIAYIYKPIACHSYNTINISGKQIHIATIDTILTFYLAFIYANEQQYNKDRLLCMANYLFEVEEHNRLENKGLLKRFSVNCYGKQLTLEDIRSEKAAKFKELVAHKNGNEYQLWFLKYTPGYKVNEKNKTRKLHSIEKEEEQEKNVEIPKKTNIIKDAKNDTGFLF
jgi:hypothetical protein